MERDELEEEEYWFSSPDDRVFSIQTNGVKASSRSVVQTVQDQLSVIRLSLKRAKKKAGDRKAVVTKSEIREATETNARLQQQSASDYPTRLPWQIFADWERLHLIFMVVWVSIDYMSWIWA